MNVEIDAIVQARIDSTRLPGKILLPIQGKPILTHIIERLQQSKRIRYVIIATTADSLSAVQTITSRYPRVKIFCGNKNDVLSRYVQAAEKHKTKVIIRATGDNPLVCPDYMDRAIEHHLQTASDLTHFLGIPLGTGVEVINTKSLKTAASLTQEAYDREHVTPYLYKNRGFFRISEPTAPNPYNRPNLKVTVDTSEDYQKVCKIFDMYGDRKIRIPDIINYFDKMYFPSQKVQTTKVLSIPV